MSVLPGSEAWLRRVTYVYMEAHAWARDAAGQSAVALSVHALARANMTVITNPNLTMATWMPSQPCAEHSPSIRPLSLPLFLSLSLPPSLSSHSSPLSLISLPHSLPPPQPRSSSLSLALALVSLHLSRAHTHTQTHTDPESLVWQRRAGGGASTSSLHVPHVCHAQSAWSCASRGVAARTSAASSSIGSLAPARGHQPTDKG
jgi:hypothetical protein